MQKEKRKDVEIDYFRNTYCDRTHSNDFNSVSLLEQEVDEYRYYHPYMYKRKLTNYIIELFDIGYDKETDCITFPQLDRYGNCVFIARRSVKGKYFNYPQGADKIVYGIYQLYQCAKFPQEIIICESMIDMLTCWSWGKFAIALNGLGTEKQIKELNKMPCRKFILATDNDKAGMRARQSLKKRIKNKIVTEYILPNGKKDINELSYKEFINLQEVF